jgi:hypothetical protein
MARTKFTRRPATSAAEQARRQAFGKTWGAVTKQISQEIKAKRKAGML